MVRRTGNHFRPPDALGINTGETTLGSNRFAPAASASFLYGGGEDVSEWTRVLIYEESRCVMNDLGCPSATHHPNIDTGGSREWRRNSRSM